MASIINTGLSALSAFKRQMETTGHNIANVNTDGFKRNRAVLHEDYNGGVRVELSRDESPGLRHDGIEDGEKIEKETSNVDLGQEIPDLMLTKRAYQANLKTIETQDEMLGSLLDTIG